MCLWIKRLTTVGSRKIITSGDLLIQHIPIKTLEVNRIHLNFMWNPKGIHKIVLTNRTKLKASSILI